MSASAWASESRADSILGTVSATVEPAHSPLMEAAVAAKDLGKLADPTVSVRAGQKNGTAFVTIEDNAGGPPEGLEHRLFEPFVSGKPKGIGLGLSMARRAVEQQGGTLAFERTASGSRFTVQLALGVP